MRYLYYHGRVTPEGVRNVEALISDAYSHGINELTLCIASEGGDVNGGIGLYNFIKMMPLTINTHAAGICASIAATVLLAGTRRTAHPLSVFVTHQATFSDGPLVGHRAPNTDLIVKPFVDIAKWTTDQVRDRFGPDDYRFDPNVAIRDQVIHEITTPVLSRDDQMIAVNIP